MDGSSNRSGRSRRLAGVATPATLLAAPNDAGGACARRPRIPVVNTGLLPSFTEFFIYFFFEGVHRPQFWRQKMGLRFLQKPRSRVSYGVRDWTAPSRQEERLISIQSSKVAA